MSPIVFAPTKSDAVIFKRLCLVEKFLFSKLTRMGTPIDAKPHCSKVYSIKGSIPVMPSMISAKSLPVSSSSLSSAVIKIPLSLDTAEKDKKREDEISQFRMESKIISFLQTNTYIHRSQLARG
mmetsp:Transcript_12111/g.20525  ORF Transcript_12111/g.20525 Transcript_12111/m.20525 type:complete len:124 (+) Transcript_12111:2379-2750(+)